jgi:tetratricopeptide (TPR) repeat protein
MSALPATGGRGVFVSGDSHMSRFVLLALLVSTLTCTLVIPAAAQSAPPRQFGNVERDRAMVPYRQGFEHLEAEDFEAATRAFQQAVDIDPQFETAFYMLGRSYMAQRRYVEAISALKRSQALYRAESGRHFTNQQEAQRYRRERIAEIDEIIRSYQSGPLTNQSREILRQLGERRRQLQESLERAGNNISIENTVPAFVSLSLGSAYFRTEKLEDAEREYKAAIAADGRSGEAHNNLAVVYLMTGRTADAEKSIRAAEKAGFNVQPQLKDDIRTAKRKQGTE